MIGVLCYTIFGDGMKLELKKAATLDLVYEIMMDAKKYFKESGIPQRQGEYPSRELLQSDIDSGCGYFMVVDGEVAGYFMMSFDGENTYREIFDGTWTMDCSYVVIHRFALRSNYRGKGLSRQFLSLIELEILEHFYYHYICIDTHRDNQVMRHLLESMNYRYAGIIYLENGEERLAYDKVLIEESSM